MNKLVLGIDSNTYGDYRHKIGVNDENGFKYFLKHLENNDIERELAGMAICSYGREIAKTLRCFEVRFEPTSDIMIVNDIELIRQNIFNGKLTILETFAWVTKGMLEAIAKALDENIQYSSMSPDDEFLKDTRDFLLNVRLILNLNEGQELHSQYRS